MKWLAAILIALAAPAKADSLRVFAAASLTEALDAALEICDPEATGVYAGSSVLARQIAQGAPADVFISANPLWMDYLEERGALMSETRLDLLGNTLVRVVNADHAETCEALSDCARDARIAVADTEHVPAGIYAKQWLENIGRYDPARLLPAVNVREALAWAARGEAQTAIVYRTDAQIEPRVVIAETAPETAHDPILYPAALVKSAQAAAGELLACLSGPEASAIFGDYGFRAFSE